MNTLLSATLLLSFSTGPVMPLPDDVTPGYPEASVPWIGHDGVHLTTTTGAYFELSTTPVVVDSVYNHFTGEFEHENVCVIPEAFAGLSGLIPTWHNTVLVVVPGVGLMDLDPTTCKYDIVATGFLPPVDIGDGVMAYGLPNSIVADWEGNVYISDSTFGALYRWDGEGLDVEVIAQAPEMGQVDSECVMPPGLDALPFFGINGLALSRDGKELYFAHSLPRGYLYAYDLESGSVRQISDFGCDVTPDEMVVTQGGDILVSLAFDPVLGDDYSLLSLGSLAVVDSVTGEITEKISGPFTFSNGEERTFGGPAAIHCLSWPLSNHCAVANHYANQVGQEFEIFWFNFDERMWPEARAW